VLAVVGSAAGEILRESFGVPVGVGLVLMLALVATLAFFGREVVTRSLAVWTVALYVVFVVYFVAALGRFGPEIAAGLAAGQVERGWAVSGFTYAMYNLAIVPAVLFSVRGIGTRREALGAGAVAAVLCIVPALLFHITFVAGYPDIVEQTLPVYAVITELGLGALLVLYVIGLFGTFIETGAGFIQGINERIDAYLIESRGVALGKPARAAIAVVGIALSLALGTFGLIALIARGYGTIAWGFFAVYVVPITTYGIWRIARHPGAGGRVAGGPATADADEARPVLAAVIRRGGRYLVGRRPASKRHGGLWEFPGGKVRHGESWLDAARRELREELGVGVVAAGEPVFRQVDPASSLEIVFVEVGIEGEPRALEHDELRWVEPPAMARLELAPADRAFAEKLVGTL
jgi:mutator protein MutT